MPGIAERGIPNSAGRVQENFKKDHISAESLKICKRLTRKEGGFPGRV